MKKKIEKKLSSKDVMNMIMKSLDEASPEDFDSDNQGQIVIYTGIYIWEDGSYHILSEEE